MTSCYRYRCLRCGETYSPDQANRVGFRCHGTPMQRVRVRDSDGSSGCSSAWVDDQEGWAVRRILPPPHNQVDAEAVEQLLGSLHGTSGALSLEIAGDARQRQMLVRGAPSVVNTVVHQLQAAYGQLSWEDPAEDDPALLPLNADPEGELFGVHGQMALRRPIFFPIKTWREFEEADPLRVLLGAFRGLREDELLLSQLVLLQPAPDDWADAYQGSTRDMDFRMQATTAAGQARAGLFALGIIVGIVDLIALFLCGGTLFRPALGALDVLKGLGGLGVLAGLNLGAGVMGWRWWRKLTTRLNANPDVVQRKVSLPAFRCALRLWAVARTPKRAEELMYRLTSAYRLYNLADGNAFLGGDDVGGTEMPRSGVGPPCGVRPLDAVGWPPPSHGRDSAYGTAPHVLPGSPGSQRYEGLLEELRHPFHVLAQALRGEDGLLLNLAELAGLWHMPVGEALELVRREEHERFVPLPEDVSDPEGVRIGRSIKDDQTTVPVSLSRDAARRNMILMGKTQMGKSNIMELLAHAAMQDEQAALVALDPQGDLARHLRGLIPPSRMHEAYYLDFADRKRVVGLNLLDMTSGIPVDKVVSDLIGLGAALWSRFWGPRMEATWRYATKTLALINRRLVAEGRPEEQYTILDVPPLLLAPQKRRQAFLARTLRRDTPEAQDAYWWWGTYYEQLRFSLQQDVISPVLTKVFRLSGNDISRTVFGQGVSTLDIRDILRKRGILLVHTATGELGAEIGGFIGAVFLNLLNIVVRERSARARGRRAPCLAIIDEFQTIPAVDYGALLSELQKFEVSFVLGTQSLARLRAIDRELPGITFAGVNTLLSFQLNYEDAEYVSGELDGIEPANLVDLEPFHAYVKTTGRGGRRLPVYSMRSRPPLTPDREVTAQVLERVSSYTRLAAEAKLETSRLAQELGADVEAQQRASRLAAALQGAREERFVNEQQLAELARMTATASTQTFTGEAGNVGRGMSTEAEPRRPSKGFRALDAEEEQ